VVTNGSVQEAYPNKQKSEFCKNFWIN